MNYSIIKGNIVLCNTTAIVLPANTKLKEGSGASRAIYEAAGRKRLTEACKGIGEAKIGTAVPTPGYDLPAKYIIHAVVPKWIDGNHNEYEMLSSAYFAALNVADAMMCKSIAFPLLSAGNNGFDKKLALEIASESISQFSGKELCEVQMIVYDDKTAKMVSELGYEVKNLNKDESDSKGNSNNLWDVLGDALNKGMEFVLNEENQKRIIECGIAVYGMVKKGIKIANDIKKND